MRVLVTGGRGRVDWATVHADLDRLQREHCEIVVVHGACPQGVDRFADEWAHEARQAGLPVTAERHPADWSIGKKAGMVRNAEMVKTRPDLVLAYPDPDGSPGTYGCVDLAVRAGLSMRINRLPSDPPKRIQRSRAAGWRKPPAAVCVTRPGRWGNPYPVDGFLSLDDIREAFRRYLRANPELVARARRELAGRDLACYCAPDAEWCHANEWLTAVNSPDLSGAHR